MTIKGSQTLGADARPGRIPGAAAWCNFQVAFTASPSEFWYYRDFVQPTFETRFHARGSLYLRKDNTTQYHISGRRLYPELERLGIPIGKKHDASIPSPVIRCGQVVPFIRGLYHAEGSIYRRYSERYKEHAKVYSNLLTIQIRMKLSTLMRQVREELTKLGILTNRLTEKAGVFALRITTQGMVRKFLEVIEPRYKTSPR
jgi:hypothetical protein